jgi:hypothetical protein
VLPIYWAHFLVRSFQACLHLVDQAIFSSFPHCRLLLLALQLRDFSKQVAVAMDVSSGCCASGVWVDVFSRPCPRRCFSVRAVKLYLWVHRI